ncbi:MAG: DUF1127 domain-containing protein [Devosia sp.]
MTTIDYDEMPVSGTGTKTFWLKQRIGALLAALSRRRERRAAFERLSELDPHLLRDIGLTPKDLRDAFEGRRSSVLFEPVRVPHERD